MKWEEAKNKSEDKTWADLELRPHGKIETKEQYDYIMYYGNHTSIAVDERYIKSFEEEKGKYIHLGSWFGGASFYFHCAYYPENIDGYFDKGSPVYEEFDYGKFGKIEFSEE